jgi:predicted transcriptional regulator
LKITILLKLLENDCKIAELREVTGARDTTIFHVLEEFEDQSMIVKTQGTYRLTSLGTMEAKILKEYQSTAIVIEKFKDFWLTHDLTDIPSHLLLSIGALKESTLVQTKASDLGVVHKTFIQRLESCKKIKGISPIFHSDFIDLFQQLLEKGSTVELIISSEVLNEVVSKGNIELTQKFLESGSLKIFLRDTCKVALALTEKSLSLGLFDLSGNYDDRNDLLSESPEAVAWGERLFEYALKDSVRIGDSLLE